MNNIRILLGNDKSKVKRKKELKTLRTYTKSLCNISWKLANYPVVHQIKAEKPFMINEELDDFVKVAHWRSDFEMQIKMA